MRIENDLDGCNFSVLHLKPLRHKSRSSWTVGDEIIQNANIFSLHKHSLNFNSFHNGAQVLQSLKIWRNGIKGVKWPAEGEGLV